MVTKPQKIDLPEGNKRVKVQFVPQQGSAATLPGGEEYLDLEYIENRNPTHRGRLKTFSSYETHCEFPRVFGSRGVSRSHRNLKFIRPVTHLGNLVLKRSQKKLSSPELL